MIEEAFWKGFYKEASSLSEPLPENFLEKALQLPKPKRDKAIQQKLKDFGAQMRQNIKSNIVEALTNIREKSIEETVEG